MKLKSLNLPYNKSALVVFILVSILLVFRLSNVSDKETSWDVLGYYLPLPATFIYDDPLLENRQWIEEINQERELTGTLYQISTSPEGKPMYFFLLGMAILYLPFFLMGHGFAYLFDFPPDGFSLPYQYFMVIGGLFYTILGLIYLRKILLNFFSDKIAAIVLLIIVLATNYSHHLSLKNLETVNVLFLFVCLVIWNTIQWHKTQKIKNLLAIGAFITLMSIVKPSEILVTLIPVFYGVISIQAFKNKWKLIVKHRVQFLWMAIVCLLIAIPQMSYWYIKTGKLFYDSYINPGVGLDVFSPYIYESLFSHKKGWLIYTPVMILSMIGFYYFFKHKKETALSLTIYLVVTSYIIFSWTEWWYGAGFSNRPLITTYPILAISLGYFLTQIDKKSIVIKSIVYVFIGLCFFLNQFQWWQLRNGILEPYRTTKEYYWATFLKTEVSEADKKLLTVYRDFDGVHEFTNKKEYRIVSENEVDFSEFENNSFKFNPEIEFSPSFEKSFDELTDKDHIWVEVEIAYKGNKFEQEKAPLIITHMDRKEGAYGYYTSKIPPVSDTNDDYNVFASQYLTPNVRSQKDKLKIYIWNKYRVSLEIAYLKITIFEKKQTI